MPETVIRRLQRLVQEAQERLDACQEKDRIETSGAIGFNRHRKDPCETEKKALAELEDQLNRALANADGIESDPLGNALAGGLAAGLASGVADLASLAGDGIESLLGDEGAGIAEGAPGEGVTDQPASPGEGGQQPGEDQPVHVPEREYPDDSWEHPGGDPDDLPPEEGGDNPNKKPTWER